MNRLRPLAGRFLRRALRVGRYRPGGVSWHYTGNLFDRFRGLEGVLADCKGASVLDFGACEGLISYEFARAGCALIHGFELDGPLVEFSQKLFRNVPVTSRFVQQDLSIEFDRFERKHAGLLLPQYDIVLFLGIYHHLENQMTAEALAGVVDGLLRRTRHTFVARTARLDAFEARVLAAGFTRELDVPAFHDVGPLRVYKRVPAP